MFLIYPETAELRSQRTPCRKSFGTFPSGGWISSHSRCELVVNSYWPYEHLGNGPCCHKSYIHHLFPVIPFAICAVQHESNWVLDHRRVASLLTRDRRAVSTAD